MLRRTIWIATHSYRAHDMNEPTNRSFLTKEDVNMPAERRCLRYERKDWASLKRIRRDENRD